MLMFACAIRNLAVSLPLILLWPREGSAIDHCFSAQHSPVFKIIQQAPPPPNNDDNKYPFYPASSFATMQIGKIASSRASAPMYYAQWANHGPRRVAKSNVGPGIVLGSKTTELFSSIESADACTMAQTASVLGDDAEATAFAGGAIKLTTSVEPGVFTDVCFLQPQRLSPNAAGIWLDYEVGDGRTPDQTERFLVKYADYVRRKGKKVILYADPLNAPSQRLTGLSDTNLPKIVDAFDLTDIMLWGGNREHDIAASFDNQMKMIRPWRPEKIFVVFELNRTTVEDAGTVAALMTKNGIKTISFWRNLAKQGGSCETPVNKKIACLAFGRC